VGQPPTRQSRVYLLIRDLNPKVMSARGGKLGLALVILGGASVAIGFFCMAGGNYLELLGPPYNLPSRFLLEARLYDAAYFLLAVGVFLIGLGWSVHQVGGTNPGSPHSRQRSRGWIAGMILVVTGFVLVTASLLYDGITDYLLNFTTSTIKLPIWSYPTTWAVIGLGILLWVIGWAVMRWPDATAYRPANPLPKG
jgi:hypothetical protein